jgi:hypothetical protein
VVEAADAPTPDKEPYEDVRTCVQCGKPYRITRSHFEWFQKMAKDKWGTLILPKRCSSCCTENRLRRIQRGE